MKCKMHPRYCVLSHSVGLHFFFKKLAMSVPVLDLTFLPSEIPTVLFFLLFILVSLLCAAPCVCFLLMLLDPAPSPDSDCNASTLFLRRTNHPSFLFFFFFFKSKHFHSNPTQIIARTHKSERCWSRATENKKVNCHPVYEVCTLLVYSHPLAVWISPLRADSFGLKYQQTLLPLLRLTSPWGYS